MTVYLDASVVVPLFLIDPFVARAKRFMSRGPSVAVSDYVAAEFAAVVGQRVRMKVLTLAEGRLAFANFDSWKAANALRVEIFSSDVGNAETMLRRLDLTLRTPDALSIAMAERVGAQLATFDDKMAECARALGLAVLDI